MPYKSREQKRLYMRTWRAEHPDREQRHRRADVLSKAYTKCTLPTQRSVALYAFTAEELEPLVKRMLAQRLDSAR